MVRAIWRNIVLAESKDTIFFDNVIYFPPESINRHYFKSSPLTTVCYWKGKAHYYDLEVNGDVHHAAAWSYPNPWWLARSIKDYVAFWKDVTVISD